ncbi:hypothetical protein Tco_0579916, partial [Tanacetum coccineum]
MSHRGDCVEAGGHESNVKSGYKGVEKESNVNTGWRDARRFVDVVYTRNTRRDGANTGKYPNGIGTNEDNGGLVSNVTGNTN